VDRRTFVRTAGLSIATTTALAGCSSPGGEGDDEEGMNGEEGGEEDGEEDGEEGGEEGGGEEDGEEGGEEGGGEEDEGARAPPQ
jgi:hypothetical protein